jgi:hypothetical protein
VDERRKRLALFVRWNIGRHKTDPMQFVLFHGRLRQGQMPAMDRVEGPAKESSVHGNAASR